MVAVVRPLESSEESNRRSCLRAPLPGTAAYLSAWRVLIARVGDLSASGAFLATTHPDPLGTRATLELELGGERVKLEVEVVRVSFFGGKDGRQAGMGVAFVDVPRDLKRRLIALLPDRAPAVRRIGDG